MGNPDEDIFFVIDDLLCDGCGICVPACPVGAISEIDGYFTVDKELCDGCGVCAEACHTDAFREWSRPGGGADGYSWVRPGPDMPGERGSRIRDIYSQSISDLGGNPYLFIPTIAVNAVSVIMVLYQLLELSGRPSQRSNGVYTFFVIGLILLFVGSLTASIWTQCMAAQLVAQGRSSLVSGLRRLVNRTIPVLLASLLILCIILGTFFISIFILKTAGMPAIPAVIICLLLLLLVMILVSLVPTAVIYDNLGPLVGFRTGLDRVSHNFGKVLLFFFFTVGLLLLIMIGMFIAGLLVAALDPGEKAAALILDVLSVIFNTAWSVLIIVAMMRLYAVLPAPGVSEDAPPAAQEPVADVPSA